MSEHSYAESEKKTMGRLGAVEILDQELERLDKSLSVLSDRLNPVRTQYDSVPSLDNVPHPEPSTQLRGRIERLSTLTARLEAITADIDL